MQRPDHDSARMSATQALDTLEEILNEETALLEAGLVTQALRLGERKQAAADALRHALGGGPLSSEDGDGSVVRERQARFRRLLTANLAVIATARNVAETLLREVSSSIAPRGPNTYGPAGRVVPALASSPLTLSRKS